MSAAAVREGLSIEGLAEDAREEAGVAPSPLLVLGAARKEGSLSIMIVDDGRLRVGSRRLIVDPVVTNRVTEDRFR